ncbi:hypothetical protein TNIN_12211 [Trichonephila inaurata madagascariensis]|uniref:Uncharacterized protein n=1 Tax=Trichonephila inaurata madagascariensis TaxID=2747483 RepID=A0A8X6WRZ2_9ARAC|nr:hypothetical protein TNIN_12211 [Trichonephila inaurata madagascariensis]
MVLSTDARAHAVFTPGYAFSNTPLKLQNDYPMSKMRPAASDSDCPIKTTIENPICVLQPQQKKGHLANSHHCKFPKLKPRRTSPGPKKGKIQKYL